MDKEYFKKLETRIGNNKRGLGSKSESLAEDYLISKNYTIVKKNFKFGQSGEIDIVAKDGETLVFVEVKSVKNDFYGDPLYFVTPQKQRSIRTAARGYLYVNNLENLDCRFDVITIKFQDDKPMLHHVINAF